MYTTTPEKNLRRETSFSKRALSTELLTWLESSGSSKLLDLNGQKWDLLLEVVEVPEALKKRMVFQVSYSLQGVFTGADFCRAQVLSEKEDKRLLSLLGEGAIVFVLFRSHFSTDTIIQAKTLLQDRVLKMQGLLGHEGLVERKKLMITEHLDKSLAFGF